MREGFSHHETVSIGGQTPDGFDATNGLSYVSLAILLLGEAAKPLLKLIPRTESS